LTQIQKTNQTMYSNTIKIAFLSTIATMGANAASNGNYIDQQEGQSNNNDLFLQVAPANHHKVDFQQDQKYINLATSLASDVLNKASQAHHEEENSPGRRSLKELSGDEFRTLICDPFTEGFISSTGDEASCECGSPTSFAVTCTVPEVCEYIVLAMEERSAKQSRPSQPLVPIVLRSSHHRKETPWRLSRE